MYRNLLLAAMLFIAGTCLSAQPSSGTINGHEFVDLGLSVKWATCNIGASQPGEYGDYFAWGEDSKEHKVVSNPSASLKFYEFSWRTYIYYFDNTSAFEMDGLILDGNKLVPKSDVATIIWGDKWRMPTNSEFGELVNDCNWAWTKRNGHCGYEITSKINGNKIFLPAAGAVDGTMHEKYETLGFYWTSELDYHDVAKALKFDNANRGWTSLFRYRGLPVRVVTK